MAVFFFLSKILSFIVTPIIWIFGLLVYAVLSKTESRKKRAVIAAVVLFYIFSNSFILDEVMRAWEIPAVKTEALGKYDAGIVLGGMMSYDQQLDRTQYERSVDRLIQAIELFKSGKIKSIFFTGGSGSITYSDIKEAPHIKELLHSLGIPDSCIITEGESKNTHENAEFSKPILEKKFPKGKFLLITSASHMRRAMACFKKAGITAIPFSVDRQSGPRKFTLDHLLIPSIEALREWNSLIHEWVGCITYKIAGYA